MRTRWVLASLVVWIAACGGLIETTDVEVDGAEALRAMERFAGPLPEGARDAHWHEESALDWMGRGTFRVDRESAERWFSSLEIPCTGDRRMLPARDTGSFPQRRSQTCEGGSPPFIGVEIDDGTDPATVEVQAFTT